MAEDKTTPATPAAAAAPAPAKEEPQATITLLDYADVLGDLQSKGRVLTVPQAEADRLIAAKLARVATAFDKKIAGVG